MRIILLRCGNVSNNVFQRFSDSLRFTSRRLANTGRHVSELELRSAAPVDREEMPEARLTVEHDCAWHARLSLSGKRLLMEEGACCANDERSSNDM